MTHTTESAASGWCLYLIECRDGTYYAGITNDLDARYQAHVSGKGARYTRSHPPLRLLGSRAYTTAQRHRGRNGRSSNCPSIGSSAT